MKCRILHETKGRLRVHLCIGRMTLRQADLLEYSMRAVDGVASVKVYDRTQDAVIEYCEARSAVLAALSSFSFAAAEEAGLVPEHTGRALNREFEDKLVWRTALHYACKLFLPAYVRAGIAIVRSVRYLKAGLSALLHGKLSVSVLDATIADLAGAMALNVDRAWVRDADGQELLVSVKDIHAGDCVVVRTGNMIPLDGRVTGGEAMVNQSSMTGESLPVRKTPGSYAYAGTVVEEGECLITVEKTMGGGRYDRIVRMIEESEKLKSTAEDRASRLADRLVPYTLGGTALVWLFTRNITKTLAVLMVDFSCALKLAMPIAVLSAMRESNARHMSVKGGRFLEAVAKADTIVFDKTGTLTYAQPRVAEVVTFGGRREDDMLRLAACLEEHYPHSLANAVVEEARVRGLNHEEYHSSVEYVVAHGISSTVEGKKVIIGSYHFVFEDEGCRVPEGDEEKFDGLSDAYSHLYLAISGELAAVVCISDPLRAEAADAVRALHEQGIAHIVMMTGDNEKTAAAVARAVGVDEYHAGVLPEDKAAYIRARRAGGHTVIMIGDGVNDTPALSEADAGIAINTGAAIAREIADMTISSQDLFELVTLRRLSEALMGRIDRNYRFIVSFNLMLIILGVTGVIQPTLSALLHNMSTLGISLRSMTNLLPENTEQNNA